MFRTVVIGACLALAALTAGACEQTREQITDRTLACGEVPEDVCLPLADDISQAWEKAELGPIVSITVTPQACPSGVAAAKCWLAEATDPAGDYYAGATYYRRADGVLVNVKNDAPVGG